MPPKKRARLGLPESEDIDDIVIDQSDDGEAADLAAGPSDVDPPSGSQPGSQVRYQSALCSMLTLTAKMISHMSLHLMMLHLKKTMRIGMRLILIRSLSLSRRMRMLSLRICLLWLLHTVMSKSDGCIWAVNDPKPM